MPFARHGVLVVNTVATVNIPARWGQTELLCHHATGVIYVTDNGDDPEVAGDDTQVCTVNAPLLLATESNRPAVVKLISSTACPYSVTGT